MNGHVTAVYRSFRRPKLVRQELAGLGIAPSHIHVIQIRRSSESTTTAAVRSDRNGSFRAV
jgi:hypothetical protein